MSPNFRSGNPILASATAALTLLLICARPLAAQANPDSVGHRNDCRLAGQVIRTGHPAPHRPWAYSVIRLCDQTGAAVLVERWETASDTVELADLAAASAQFPTRAMFEAMSVAARSSPEADVRVYAMSVLASFADPNVGLSLGDLRNPRPGRRPRIVTTSGDGGERAPVAMRDEVLAVLRQVRAETVDDVVRRVADEYIRFLSSR